MRHNLRVPAESSRTSVPLRARQTGLLAAFLAIVSLIGVMAPGALAAEPPSIAKPADQASPVNVPITPLTITGERMHELVARGLPQGLTLELKSETEAVVTGTPTTVETTTVELEAKNGAGEEAETEFKWKIEEPPPAVTEPAHQFSVV